MTEKEIVEYLKENRTKGVGFAFLPEEVKEWCKNNSCKLIYYQPNDLWNRNSAKEYLFVSNEIVALPEDFDLVPKSEGGWVEFEIIDNFFFCSDKKEHPIWYFDWWDWQGFLTESSNSDLDYTAFGGWQYPNNKGWHMCPQMLIDGEYASILLYRSVPSECKPAIPTKIRFWREAE